MREKEAISCWNPSGDLVNIKLQQPAGIDGHCSWAQTGVGQSEWAVAATVLSQA